MLAGVFGAAFLSATLLFGLSEAAVVAAALTAETSRTALFLAATSGNVLGAPAAGSFRCRLEAIAIEGGDFEDAVGNEADEGDAVLCRNLENKNARARGGVAPIPGEPATAR